MVLSSVRLMIAFGGNRDSGVLKENRARTLRLVGSADDVPRGLLGGEDFVDSSINVKEVKMKAQSITILGVRMMTLSVDLEV